LVERPARKFRSLVGSQRLRIAPETGCSVQRSRDVQAGDAVVNNNIDSLLGEIVVSVASPPSVHRFAEPAI
jgi:hypothetical protein